MLKIDDNTINKRWNMLSDFVKDACHNRDPSHGWEHMKIVAETSKYIIQQDYKNYSEFNKLILDAITVGWLHDVADHKYDTDGKMTNLLISWGMSNIENFPQLLKAVKLVSFSSENKAILLGKPIEYDTELGYHLALVRHIVSDADKLEAIGLIGMERAIGYTRHANPEHSMEQIISDVKKHAHEKLLRLAGEFMRTPTGKQIAQIRHNEMLHELSVI